MNGNLKQFVVIVIGVVVFVLLFSLCNPFNREIFLLEDPQIDSFVQNEVSGKVDILWVVDNSPSMETSQNNLAKNLSSFINQFIDADTDELLDFQMAVVTTDFLQDNGKFVQQTILHQQNALEDRDQFMTAFEDLLLVGTAGMGLECDLMSMLQAVERSENQEFFRDDAILVVNILSDEADMSEYFRDQMEELIRNNQDRGEMPGDDYESFFELTEYFAPSQSMENQPVKYFVEELKRFKQGRRVMINSIVNTSKYAGLGGLFGGVYGKQQIEASQLTNGLVADLSQDFASTLSNMGENISKLASSFALSRKADGDDRMMVLVNGEEILDWIYNPEYQTLEFVDGYVPPSGADIEIHYEVFNEYEEGEDEAES